ncbi:RTA1 like protein-domain-containing protein [Colletotrichum godetiae]|uniref:RTA1 like protein-domain-containing protein n=1 Tax=Colletotrichum godetiae TaxID=1209918 RepID=A0AAJ0ALC6_9PEZI|nr:RTA1 like protein-domain-containing protein [Colletotrichum godetiae]KAK1676031.1 RTA1 like protein-domain-containing protein [Colletotrichum godetiae]
MADNSTTTETASTGFVFYHYEPSIVAATVFIIVFGVSGMLHIWQLCRRKTWYFIPFVIGCIFEAVGYVGRAMSASEAPDYTKNPYIIQSILLLLGPALFAASIYMVLGRLINLLDAGEYSLIRPKWLTKVFVLGDVLSFFAQSGGGGMLATAKNSDNVKLGENIIVGGLGIQILFFGFFIVVTLVFHIRLSRNPTSKSHTVQTPWKGLLYVLYATSFFIMVRSLFRVAEYIGGKDSELQAKEMYIYIFDATLMGITSMAFNWFHPSRVINAQATGLKQVSSSEVLNEGYLMESGQYPKPQQQQYQDPRYEPYQGAAGQQGFRR